MITFVLSFFSTFSSAAEKNSALSPSLIRPSTQRIVKFSVCFFSTIKTGSPYPAREKQIGGHEPSRPLRWQKQLDAVDHVAERFHGAGAVVRNRDVKLLLDREEDGERVERVDAG